MLQTFFISLMNHIKEINESFELRTKLKKNKLTELSVKSNKLSRRNSNDIIEKKKLSGKRSGNK